MCNATRALSSSKCTHVSFLILYSSLKNSVSKALYRVFLSVHPSRCVSLKQILPVEVCKFFCTKIRRILNLALTIASMWREWGERNECVFFCMAFAHTMYLCSLYDSRKRQLLFPCVGYAVDFLLRGTELWNVMNSASRLSLTPCGLSTILDSAALTSNEWRMWSVEVYRHAWVMSRMCIFILSIFNKF